MTAPQPDPQQDQGLSPTEKAVIAALALYFASTAAVSAVRLPARLVAQLATLGLSTRAIRAAGRMTMAPALTGRGRHGSPTTRTTTSRAVKADEPTMRAQYLLAAAKRLTQANTLGVYPQALRVEPTYLAAHRYAGQNRARAAATLDRVALTDGPYLKWMTKNDAKVEAECRALAGTIFTVDNLPTVKGISVMPGAVHPHCRCYPVGAYSRTDALPTIKAQPVGVS